MRGEGRERRKKIEEESRSPFIRGLLDASVPPGAESDFWPTMPSREQRGDPKSDFWPTMPSREQRGDPKSDPGGVHYHFCS